MNAKFAIGAIVLLVAIGTSNMGALAQSQPVQPTATSPTPPSTSATATMPAPSGTMAPAVAPPSETPAAPVAEPAKVATTPKPHLSRCALAIRAVERKLEKSTASPDKVASAWRHIEEAKSSKGQVCQAHAREASEQL